MSTREQDHDDDGVLIIADEPCDECVESMVYDKESGGWVCSNGECKARRLLDTVEESERSRGEGKFKFVKY